MAVSSDVATNSQASSESVLMERNEGSGKKRRKRSGSEKREVKEIELVESGSEDGEIVEMNQVDREPQGTLSLQIHWSLRSNIFST